MSSPRSMLRVREVKHLLNCTAELWYLLGPVRGRKAVVKGGWNRTGHNTLLSDLGFMLLTIFHVKKKKNNFTLKSLPSILVASHLLPSFFIPFKVSCPNLQQQHFPHTILGRGGIN